MKIIVVPAATKADVAECLNMVAAIVSVITAIGVARVAIFIIAMAGEAETAMMCGNYGWRSFWAYLAISPYDQKIRIRSEPALRHNPWLAKSH